MNILVSLPHHVAARKSFNKLKTTCKLKLRAFTYFSKWKEEGALICPSNPMNIISQIFGISSYYTCHAKWENINKIRHKQSIKWREMYLEIRITNFLRYYVPYPTIKNLFKKVKHSLLCYSCWQRTTVDGNKILSNAYMKLSNMT